MASALAFCLTLRAVMTAVRPPPMSSETRLGSMFWSMSFITAAKIPAVLTEGKDKRQGGPAVCMCISLFLDWGLCSLGKAAVLAVFAVPFLWTHLLVVFDFP